MTFKRCIVALATLAALGPALAQQAYPNKPITLIVPYPPGGITDIAGRATAKAMSEQLGQTVIVDNRAGAGGTIGASAAARAAADGYTVFMGTSATHGTNPTTLSHLNYDAAKDFTAVALVASAPLVVAANPDLPAKTIEELIGYLKANPDKVAYASTGTGGSVHLSVEHFKLMTGTQMQHIPYKGSSPALTDLVGGRVQIMFDNVPSATPLVKAGKLRALAVTGAEPVADLPGVPTVDAAGVKGFQTGSWVGIYAPAGTPPAIVDKLNAAINAGLKSPALRETFAVSGLLPEGGTPQSFTDFTAAEIRKWADVAKRIGYQPQ